jgi:hypothetical protein
MCPSCQRSKNPRHYLCHPCWRQLPPATRTALYRRDGHAGARLLLLLQQIRRQVPLSEIRIQETFHG